MSTRHPLRSLYDWLLLLAAPWFCLRLLLKSRRDARYRRGIGERFGAAPESITAGSIWFHVASAGEAITAAPTIRALAGKLTDAPLLVTTTTPTGAERVRALLGDIVQQCHVPYDLPWSVDRFLKRVRPRALVILETELWPNLIEKTAQTGAPVYVLNARLSEQSFRGYRRVAPAISTMLSCIDRILCQYPDTARRFRDLGVPGEAIAVTGSVKFDLETPAPPDASVRAFAEGGATWIAGSTHPGEDEIVLDAYLRIRERLADTRLILVPRHPERAHDIERLIAARGLTHVRQSSGEREGDVLVGDVMGTLSSLYGLARAAYIGGSLNDTGGHNPIEAAVHGVPMLMGPERRNFLEVCSRFEEADCLHLVRDAKSLADAVCDLLRDDDRRERQGRAAQEVVRNNQGSRAKVLRELEAWFG